MSVRSTHRDAEKTFESPDLEFAAGDFGLQRGFVDSGEVEEMPVHPLDAIAVFAIFAGHDCATFIEDARQENVAAQRNAWAARWTLREIERSELAHGLADVDGRGSRQEFTVAGSNAG